MVTIVETEFLPALHFTFTLKAVKNVVMSRERSVFATLKVCPLPKLFKSFKIHITVPIYLHYKAGFCGK